MKLGADTKLETALVHDESQRLLSGAQGCFFDRGPVTQLTQVADEVADPGGGADVVDLARTGEVERDAHLASPM